MLAGISLGASHDDAVDHDQRDVNAQRLIHLRQKALHQKVNDRHKRCDDDDVGRHPHPLGNDLSQQRDEKIRHHQDRCRGKSHTDGIGHRGCRCQRRAHSQDKHENRILKIDSVHDSFLNRVLPQVDVPAQVKTTFPAIRINQFSGVFPAHSDSSCIACSVPLSVCGCAWPDRVICPAAINAALTSSVTAEVVMVQPLIASIS